MPAMTIEAQIAFAQIDDRYTTALRMFERLNRDGWHLAIFEATDGIYYVHTSGPTMRVMSGPHLLVSGTDNCGDALSGVITTRGDFSGSPLD